MKSISTSNVWESLPRCAQIVETARYSAAADCLQICCALRDLLEPAIHPTTPGPRIMGAQPATIEATSVTAGRRNYRLSSQGRASRSMLVNRIGPGKRLMLDVSMTIL